MGEVINKKHQIFVSKVEIIFNMNEVNSDIFSRKTPEHYTCFKELVSLVKANDPQGLKDLHHTFEGGVRRLASRRMHPAIVEDVAKETFLIVIRTIHLGELREAELLPGLFRTVVHDRVEAHIAKSANNQVQNLETFNAKRMNDSKELHIQNQRLFLMSELLKGTSPRDREALIRFYVRGQSQQDICSSVGLTDAEFLFAKSQVKSHFSELARRPLATYSLRMLASVSPADIAQQCQ